MISYKFPPSFHFNKFILQGMPAFPLMFCLSHEVYPIHISKSIFILITIIFLYSLLRTTKIKSNCVKQISTGIYLSIAVVVILANSWQDPSGPVFDARTILFVLSGAYFGVFPTLIALVTGIAYRIFAFPLYGVLPGVLSMIVSALVGIVFHKYNHNIRIKNQYLKMYILGVVAHALIMIEYIPLLFLTLPWEQISSIIIIFLGIYPIVVALMSLGLEKQKEFFSLEEALRKEKSILSSTLNSSNTIEIFSLDKKYRYLSFNDYHKKQIKEYYGIDIKLGDNFIEIINIIPVKKSFQNHIDSFFAGEDIIKEFELKIAECKYLKEIYAPIYDKQTVVGLTIFIMDVSKEKNQELKILDLSYIDALTGVYNRRFFQEKFDELQDNKFMPLTILISDMNGLKETNDVFGHQEGDRLLITFAQMLKKYFDTANYICRIGGDEFVVLMPNQTSRFAEEKIKQVSSELAAQKEFKFPLSFSYGIATGMKEKTIQYTLHEAEEQMYQHKLVSRTSHRNVFIKSLLNTLSRKIPDMKDSINKVVKITTKIGHALDLNQNEINLLGLISTIFDIGKIAISEEVLNKKGPLSEQEWKEVKKHPEVGYRMIASSSEYAAIATDVLYHQERWDGSGYPVGLKQTEIPLKARIIAVADAYASMTSFRPYRKTKTHEEAIQELIRCSGTQFDPEIVAVFVKLFKNSLD